MRRRIFSVGRGGLAAAVAAACLLVPVAASAAPTPDQAVAELNQWRTELGESSVATPSVPALNTGCQHHDTYEDANGPGLTHTESNALPDFTTDGQTAGLDSVLAETSAAASDAMVLPGPLWDDGVFHRAALLEPRLALTGFDATPFHDGLTFACMWIQNQSSAESPQVMDNTRATPTVTLYPSPANGAYQVPRTFPAGSEAPDPAQETGVPAGATLGWLLNVEINGPWANAEFGNLAYASDVTATLAPDGTSNDVPVVVSQCGSSGCFGPGDTTDGRFFDGGFGIFPTQPLAANTIYRVVLTGGAVTDVADNTTTPMAGFSWCFSTGAGYTASADCAPATTAAEEVSHPNASTVVMTTPTTPALPGTGGVDLPSTPPSTPPRPGAGPPVIGTGPPASGTGAHHQKKTDRPGASGTLAGVAHGHPKLVLRLRAAKSAAGIRRFAVTLPHGMSFSRHGLKAGSGVRVISGHTRLRVTLRLRHRILIVTVRHPVLSVVLTVRRPVLRVSRLLVHTAGGRHPARLTFSITTTAGGSTTHRRLRLTPH